MKSCPSAPNGTQITIVGRQGRLRKETLTGLTEMCLGCPIARVNMSQSLGANLGLEFRPQPISLAILSAEGLQSQLASVVSNEPSDKNRGGRRFNG